MELIPIRQPQLPFSGNPLVFSWAITPFAAAMINADVHVIITVLVEDDPGSSNYIEAKKTKVFPDINGVVTIDVADIVDAWLKYFTPPPDADTLVNGKPQTRGFIVQPRVFVGTVQQAYVDNPDKSIFGVKGGIPYEYIPDLTRYKRDNISPSTLEKEGLQFFDDEERVFPDDIFFITFLKDFGFSLAFYYDIEYLLDGEYETASGLIKESAYNGSGKVVFFPAGFNQLALQDELPADAIPIKYTIRVTHKWTVDVTDYEGPVLSETFIIDHRKFYNTYQLLYRNSLGGLQPLRLLGQVDFEAAYSGESVKQVQQPSHILDKNLLPLERIEFPEEQPKFIGNTGFISKFESDRMRDLFLSKEVYLVKDNRFVPVIVNKSNAKFYSNNDSLYNIEFEFRHAFTNHFFSPPILPDAACPAVISLSWRQSGDDQITVFWQLPFGYDYAQLKILWEDDSEEIFYLEGNSGAQKIDFTRPGFATENTDLIVSARVVCDRYKETVSYGAYTVLDAANISPEYTVIALPDRYALPKGYSSAVAMPNALLNDYDPDGGSIEAIADTGASNDSGSFTIDAAGAVTYTPPSSSYTGEDYFDYEVRKVGGTATSTARYTIVVY